jgi:hypothetical protein
MGIAVAGLRLTVGGERSMLEPVSNRRDCARVRLLWKATTETESLPRARAALEERMERMPRLLHIGTLVSISLVVTLCFVVLPGLPKQTTFWAYGHPESWLVLQALLSVLLVVSAGAAVWLSQGGMAGLLMLGGLLLLIPTALFSGWLLAVGLASLFLPPATSYGASFISFLLEGFTRLASPAVVFLSVWALVETVQRGAPASRRNEVLALLPVLLVGGGQLWPTLAAAWPARPDMRFLLSWHPLSMVPLAVLAGVVRVRFGRE